MLIHTLIISSVCVSTYKLFPLCVSLDRYKIAPSCFYIVKTEVSHRERASSSQY